MTRGFLLCHHCKTPLNPARTPTICPECGKNPLGEPEQPEAQAFPFEAGKTYQFPPDCLGQALILLEQAAKLIRFHERIDHPNPAPNTVGQDQPLYPTQG